MDLTIHLKKEVFDIIQKQVAQIMKKQTQPFF
jgi:hypothetical protein